MPSVIENRSSSENNTEFQSDIILGACAGRVFQDCEERDEQESCVQGDDAHRGIVFSKQIVRTD